MLIDETNSRSFRRFRVFAMRGSCPAYALSVTFRGLGMPRWSDWRAAASRAARLLRYWFDAPGEGAALTEKSAALSFVSCPSGIRSALLPGAAVAGGAAATCPSTKAFVASP